MNEPYRMFLDDLREPPDDGGEWVVVRSFDEAVNFVRERGYPTFVSFDHDLGEDSLSGKDFANWLVELDMDEGTMPLNFGFYIHSANPTGADNIRGLIQRYLEFREQNETK